MFMQDLKPGDLYKIRPADPIDPAIILSLSLQKNDANALYGTIRALVHRRLVLERMARTTAEKFFREAVVLARCPAGSTMFLSITAGSSLALANHTVLVEKAMRGSTAYKWTSDDEERLICIALILEVHMRAPL